MSNNDLQRKLNELERELNKHQRINSELHQELSILVNGVNRADKQLSDYNRQIQDTMDECHGLMNQSHDRIISAHELQGEIERLYVKFKNIELANKKIRACNNKKYYEFGNYRTVRKIVQGMMDNLDFQMISDKTITKSVEIQHLQTPDYWLTCVLISIIAWRNDDRELANRAMDRAIKLDKKNASVFYMIFNLRMAREDAALKWFAVFQDCDLFGSDRSTLLLLFSLISKYIKDNIEEDTLSEVNQYIKKIVQDTLISEGFSENDAIAQIDGHLRLLQPNEPVDYSVLAKYCTEFSELSDLMLQAKTNIHILDFVSSIVSVSVEQKNAFLKAYIDELIAKPNSAEKSVYEEIRYNETIIECLGELAVAQERYQAKRQQSENTLNPIREMINWIHSSDSQGISDQNRLNMFTLTKDLYIKAVTLFVNRYRSHVKSAYAFRINEYSEIVDFQDESHEKQKVIDFYTKRKNGRLAEVKDFPAFIGFGLAAASVAGSFFAGYWLLVAALAGIGFGVYTLLTNKSRRRLLEFECQDSIRTTSDILTKLFGDFRSYQIEFAEYDMLYDRIVNVSETLTPEYHEEEMQPVRSYIAPIHQQHEIETETSAVTHLDIDEEHENKPILSIENRPFLMTSAAAVSEPVITQAAVSEPIISKADINDRIIINNPEEAHEIQSSVRPVVTIEQTVESISKKSISKEKKKKLAIFLSGALLLLIMIPIVLYAFSQNAGTKSTTQSTFAQTPVISNSTVTEATIPEVLQLSQSEIVLLNGSQTQLTVTSNKGMTNNSALIWITDNDKVAQIDADGVIKANSIGSALITVTTAKGDVIGKCRVTIQEPVFDLTSLTIEPENITLSVGQMANLMVRFIPVNATNKNVVWSSDNTAVATVDSNGSINAIGAGTAKIKVSSLTGQFEATCTVTIVATAPTTTETTAETTAGTTVGTSTTQSSKIQVTVPNVVGKTASQASSILSGLGLSVFQSQTFNRSVASGFVISQSYASGAKLDIGTKITIVVSKGASVFSDWVLTLPSHVTSTNYIIEEKTQYQYSDKEFTTGPTPTMSGWFKYNESFVWSAWSAWSMTAVSATANREVNTKQVANAQQYKTVHRYERWMYINTSNLWTSSYAQYMGTAYKSNGHWERIELDYQLSIKGYTDNRAHYGSYAYGSYTAFYNDYWWNYSTAQVALPLTYHTEYQYRDKIFTYYFYRYKPWSPWQDEVVTATADRQVQTRKVYRFRERD